MEQLMTTTNPKAFKAEKLAKLFRQMIWMSHIEHPGCKTCQEANKWAGDQLDLLLEMK
jgi:hypothetical protein